jgi:tetratricopeptide (TPR) repeat protein
MLACRRWLVVLCGMGMLCAGPARAEDAPAGPPPEARRAFADGKAAYERGDYDRALQLFQRAALIAPAPSLYYNIGMAYERLGRFEDSAIAFEKYLQLIDAPSTEEEKTFQANLRARAAANRARPQRSTEAPPAPLVEPPAGAVNRYPAYYYPPGAMPAIAAPVPLTHQQKLDKARRHRNNGIALTVVGSVLVFGGIAIVTWGALAPGFIDWQRGLTIWAGTLPLVTGITFVIPGAVVLGKWQKELNAELKRPDDGAAAHKAALDLAAPPPTLALPSGPQLVLGTPVLRF